MKLSVRYFSMEEIELSFLNKTAEILLQGMFS